jgi:uncharacterized repeat protein (TIGR03803 family)
MTARALLMTALLTAPAAGAEFELLASFQRGAAQPMAALTETGGFFYSTAVSGGAHGGGAVLRMDAAGAVTLLASLRPAEHGAGPVAAPAAAADGTLYGTATAGGAGGFGTVYKVTPEGALSAVVSFTGSSGAARGSVPQGLVRHTDGNFYGLTAAGGTGGQGTVFRLTPEGVLTTLADFTGVAGAMPGAQPQGTPVFSGNTLYGVTKGGGASGMGTVFSVTAAGAFTSMAAFTGAAGARPGAEPAGGLLLAGGAFYGTTEFGGANDFGTAFRITAAGGFTSLRSFADATGSQPAGSLTAGGDGALYGATAAGGTSGAGTLYRLTTTGAHTVLTNLSPATGATPRGGLITGADGSLYGAASAGGAGNGGAFFKVTTTGVFTPLAAVTPAAGWLPSGPPVEDTPGVFLFPMAAGGAHGGGVLSQLTSGGTVTTAASAGGTTGDVPAGTLLKNGAHWYGVALRGGTADRGTAFRYSAASGLTLLASYANGTGSVPDGGLITGGDGALYGTAMEGGTALQGTLYKVTTAGARTRLVSFTGTGGAAKGSRPRGRLVFAANNNYYGLCEMGGAANAGTLFRMSAAGTVTILAEFSATGPRHPLGGLVSAADGSLYGTVSAGGAHGAGALLRVLPSANTWSTVADFAPGTTGSTPAGALLATADGAICGLTTAGGSSGAGTVWRYTAAAGLETLAAFTGENGPAPGTGSALHDAVLHTGGLCAGSDGTLYGVTAGGGPGGGGTAFRILTPLQRWKRTLLGDTTAPDDGDPDADGLVNLMEYALGTHPLEPGPSPLVPVLQPEGLLAITVPRDPVRSDIIITIEATSDPAGPWTTIATSTRGTPFTGPGYLSGDSTSPGLKSVLIRDPGSSATRRFLRLVCRL